MIVRNNTYAKKIRMTYGTGGSGGTNRSEYTQHGEKTWDLDVLAALLGEAPYFISQVAPLDTPFNVGISLLGVEEDVLYLSQHGKEYRVPLGESYSYRDGIAYDTYCQVTVELYSRPLSEMEEDFKRIDAYADAEPERGFREFSALCAEGMGAAARAVGWFYENGVYVEKDLEKAKEYYRLGAKRGDGRSWQNLADLVSNEGNYEEAEWYYKQAMSQKVAFSFSNLAALIFNGDLHDGNQRLAGLLAVMGYRMEEPLILGLCYFTGVFFPKVYSYAKYCFQKAEYHDEALREMGLEFPEFWDQVEPVEPHFPDYSENWQEWFREECPKALLDSVTHIALKAEDYSAEEVKQAEDACSRAATLGYSRAMYYTFFLEFPNAEEWLKLGAEELGDLDCIETLAALYTESAQYKIGNRI